jgi:carbonic anhydrase
MDKGTLSPNDLTILKTQLWCRDFKEYRGKYPDRTRVEISAAILLYCFTSARTGEVHESTARRERARKQRDMEGVKTVQVMAACYRVSRKWLIILSSMLI